MSSEATTLTVVTRKKPNPAQYWAFFTRDDGPFWDFMARSRENAQTQEASPRDEPQDGVRPHSTSTGSSRGDRHD